MPALMRPKSKYWEVIESLYDTTLERAQKQLAREYKRAFQETLTKVNGIYYQLLEKSRNGTILASDLYSYDKYYKLLNELNDKCSQLGVHERQIIENKLTNMYKQCSSTVGKAFNVPNIDDEKAIRAVNSIWCQDGISWSNRIWTDKSALVEKLKDGLVDCIVKGDSSAQLKKSLMRDFNIAYNNADRIVRTELAHVQTQAAIDKYEEAGLTKYKVLPAKDEKVCDVCFMASLNTYSLDEITVPLHPNCRCCTIGVVDV